MKSSRRQFISTAVTGGLAASLPLSSCNTTESGSNPTALAEKYETLDQILKQPLLKRELFTSPVIIESVELLRYENNFLCRVRSVDGAIGVSVGHSGQLQSLYPVFTNLVQPFFIGKDARELDLILERVYVYKLNFRLSGLALGVPLATLEFAILDMLGHIAGKPMGQLIGKVHHPEVEMYQATEYRDLPVESSMEMIMRDVQENNARALKIKIGGLMFETGDLHAVGPSGRTETMIPLVRKTFGDDLVLYADANGFYTVEEAIRAGKLLEAYNYQFFEEPVPFHWYEETRQVADALSIPIAGGEQEFSLHGFRWLIANNGLEVVQPDLFYFGGMIRSMKVALMAQAFGKSCTPHMSGGDLGFLYMMHFVSVLPNAMPHHEFKGFRTHIAYECKTSPLQSKNGAVQVPTGPGLGVEIDPGFMEKFQAVRTG